MKKRKIIVGLASIALLVGCGAATYEKSVQIDLGSGVIREVRKSLGITLHQSSPKETTISQALGESTLSSRWLTISEQGYSFPGTRSHPCYAKILFRVGGIDRSYPHQKVAAMTARMTLQELGKTGDPCAMERHLDRFWNALLDDFDPSWSDSEIDSEIPRIWERTTNGKGGTPPT